MSSPKWRPATSSDSFVNPFPAGSRKLSTQGLFILRSKRESRKDANSGGLFTVSSRFVFRSSCYLTVEFRE